MKKIFIMLALCASMAYGVTPLAESASIEKDILNGKLYARTEKALDNAIKVACGELKKRGYLLEAATFEQEWVETYRAEFLRFATSRDIGEHSPLSGWLAQKYDQIEMLLGVDVCKKTHLSDIKSLNHGLPVTFRPCSFPMDAITIPRKDEYRNHTSQGKIYYGVIPVTSFWVIYGTVTVVTSGTGYVFLAGMIAEIGEKLMAIVSPKISDTIFDKACGDKDAH